jgi:thymidylate kinase
MNRPSEMDIDAGGEPSYEPSGADAPPLDLVVTLCTRLRQARVRYCRWKTNDMIHLSANGTNDLDLLVARNDLGAFLAVLAELGFKEARPRPGRQIPGVWHFYGHDVPSGRFVHVDAQAHLVVGDDTTKNVRVPIEGAYLASARQGTIFALPAAELELAVLVLRIALKRGTLDALAFGLAGLRAGERRELDDLWERVNGDRLREVVRTHLAVVGWDLWESYAEALRSGAPVLTRLRLGRRVVGALAPYSRRAPAADGVVRSLRRVEWVLRRFVFGQRNRKRLVASGAVVALIGGDGAGKSTAVDGLARWLGGPMQTRHVHLGKPPMSPTTVLVKGTLFAARRAGLLRGPWLPHYPTATERRGITPSTAWLAWQLVTARDRRRLYRRATRAAARGDIVVCDRFPLPQITLMDGARTRWVDPASLGRLGRWLVAAERRCYDEMPRPDVLIVLRVDPDIAVARKRGVDPAEFVRPRAAEVYTAGWSGSGAEVVDAGQPADAVLRDLRRIVWSRL